MEYVLDASNQSFGRIASQAAKLLRGKGTPAFETHVQSDARVTIKNASKIAIHPRKMRGKVYLRYSGYPGGQKAATLEEMITKKGYKGVFENAVYGMLPANRLRKQMLKNLIIED